MATIRLPSRVLDRKNQEIWRNCFLLKIYFGHLEGDSSFCLAMHMSISNNWRRNFSIFNFVYGLGVELKSEDKTP